MTVSLAKLRTFIAIAEEGQFNKAAQRLGTSQPSLSAQLRELEQVLGVSLFNRTTRSVALTAEGARFLHRARQFLRDLNDAVADMQNLSSLNHGRIVIAATPSVSSTLLPQAINAFRASFPEIQIQVHEDILVNVEQMVANGLADFGIAPQPERSATLDFSLLLTEKFFGVVPLGHALAQSDHATLAALAGYPMLASKQGAGIRETTEHALQDHGIFPNIAHVLLHQQTILSMAEAGLGVGYLPALVILSGGVRRLHLLDVSDPEASRRVGILQRKGGSASAAAAEFIKRVAGGELLAGALCAEDPPSANGRRLLAGIATAFARDTVVPC